MNQWFFIFALGLATPSLAQDIADDALAYEENELVDDLIHSDLPLYGLEGDDMWPRGMVGLKDSFGCESRVAFGDWQFQSNPIDEDSRSWWIRVSNYGVIHCLANFFKADAREELDDGDLTRGYFVRIGEEERGGKTHELWVMQQGWLPGSNYVLLAREPEQVLVKKFTMLQSRCPRGAMRRAETLTGWVTDYCVINSREDMLSPARDMLALEPLGTLTLEEESDEVASPASKSTMM